MKLYINKNGQQHGPFDEAKILEMLRKGQLSPNDFGIKDGQQNWQKLGEMFPPPKQTANIPPINKPNVQVNQQVTPTLKKSGSSKGLMFGLIGCGGLILLSVVGLLGYFAFGNKTSNNSTANSNSNSNSNTKTAAPIPTDFTSMKDKAEELAKLSPALKLDSKAKIKGKVAWVEKGQYDAKMDFFDTYYKEISESNVTSYGLTKEMLAFKPEEIDTLVQTICTKGKVIGHYEKGVTGYANNCKVSLIDYKNNVIFAQKTFTNSKLDKTISSVYAGSKEFIVITPFVEIQNYVKSFVPEKVEVSADSLPNIENTIDFAKSAEKFGKLSFPVKLDGNAKIKGKVAIIDKSSVSTPYLTGVESDGKISEPLPNSIGLTKEGFGIADNQIALKTSEIETLIQVSCKRGSLITKVKGISVFSNVCEVNVVDYKAMATVAQKTFEGKTINNNRYSDPSSYDDKTDEVSFPREEIYEFIKQFPKG